MTSYMKRYHNLKGDIELYFIPTQYQLPDIFTKPLDEPTFKRLIVELAKVLKSPKVFFSNPTGGIFGEVGVNTFRNAIEAHYLPYSSEYVPPSSINIVRQYFPTNRYRRKSLPKELLKKDSFLLGRDALADSTTEADLRKSAPPDSIPQQQSKDKGTKNYTLDHIFAGTDLNVLADKAKSFDEVILEDHSKLVHNVPTDFIVLDSLEDDPIIVADESEEGEEGEDEGIHADSNVETEDTFIPKYPSLSSLPTELKELPSKFNELLKKLKEFSKTATNLTSQVTELKTLQWELPSEFLSIPTQAIAYASKKTKDASVPSASQASTQRAKGEKNTNQSTISHPPKSSLKTEEEHIKTDKGKKVVSLKDAEEECSNSECNAPLRKEDIMS
nr:retrovirus-related Pol polyprotein from transposon TNT 1-94 [Tanacetum cinerariifolium]